MVQMILVCCYQDAALKDEDQPARVKFCQDVLDDMQVEMEEDGEEGENGEDTPLTAEEDWFQFDLPAHCSYLGIQISHKNQAV